jgi:hypothetical protein
LWLLVSLAAAIVSTLSYFAMDKRHRLGTLSAMFWGLTLMVLIDHVIGYDGGAFFQMDTPGMVGDGVVLGLLMLLPVVAIWASLLAIDRIFKKRNEVN